MKAKGGQMIKSMGGASWISGKGGRGKIRKIIKDKLVKGGSERETNSFRVNTVLPPHKTPFFLHILAKGDNNTENVMSL